MSTTTDAPPSASPGNNGSGANHMEFSYLQKLGTDFLSPRSSMQRVKVYRLNGDGRWDDKGTGHVSVEYLERSQSLGMVVIDEEDNQTLLVHRISADDIYRRQEDTIISWTDPEVATDLALSFQEPMGCGFIWDQISNVQRSARFPNPGALDNGPRVITDELEHSDDVFHDSGNSELPDLPAVELSSLPQILKSVAEVSIADKDRIASLIMREQNYIPKLLDLFTICEDMENTEGLHMLCKIVKGLISLNDRQVFDVIFSDEYIMEVVGALEYDPELSCHQDHRGFLKHQVVFKEAVPIHDAAIVSKIHQTYRIGYIKDVILPRILDDQTFATLNSMMMSNNKAVVSALYVDKTFIDDFFTKLRSSDLPETTQRELILFLHEFCNLSKNMQPFHRTELFCALVDKGLFDVMTTVLQSEDATIRGSGCDILIVLLNHDASLLRNFLIQQSGHVLFRSLIKSLLTPSEGGLQCQLLEIMRLLLHADTTDRQQVEKNAFLDLFYEKYMDQLVEVLTVVCPLKITTTEQSKKSPTEGQEVSAEILGNVCELMCLCVLHHGYRIKYYIMRNNVAEKVLRLVRRKEKFLVVAAVRFLRTCVGLKDEFYDRYLIKNSLFEPVVQAFLANGNRYNLLNSAVLELIDFIWKSNIKRLIAHLVENYAEKLEVVDYVDTIQQLKRKHEQSMEDDSAPPIRESPAGATESRLIGPFPDPRTRKDERALDKDEEDYFNEDSDEEEDSASAPATAIQAVIINGSTDIPFRSSMGLVNYDDEDDDSAAPLVNGKDGRKPEAAGAHSASIWPDIENLPVTKRKSSPEETASEAKRHKEILRQPEPGVQSRRQLLEAEARTQDERSEAAVEVRQGEESSSGDIEIEVETTRKDSTRISSLTFRTGSGSGQEKGVVLGCKVQSRVSSEPSNSR